MVRVIALSLLSYSIFVISCHQGGETNNADQKAKMNEQAELSSDSATQIETSNEVYPDFTLGLADGTIVQFDKDSPEFFFIEMMKQNPEPAASMGIYLDITYTKGTTAAADTARYSKVIKHFASLINANPTYQFELIGANDPGTVDEAMLRLSGERSKKMRIDLLGAGVAQTRLIASRADVKFPGASEDLNVVNPVKRLPIIRPSSKR